MLERIEFALGQEKNVGGAGSAGSMGLLAPRTMCAKCFKRSANVGGKRRFDFQPFPLTGMTESQAESMKRLAAHEDFLLAAWVV